MGDGGEGKYRLVRSTRETGGKQRPKANQQRNCLDESSARVANVLYIAKPCCTEATFNTAFILHCTIHTVDDTFFCRVARLIYI